MELRDTRLADLHHLSNFLHAEVVDKFDPDKGIKFETYVSKRIRGAVIDLARRQDWVPRSVRASRESTLHMEELAKSS